MARTIRIKRSKAGPAAAATSVTTSDELAESDDNIPHTSPDEQTDLGELILRAERAKVIKDQAASEYEMLQQELAAAIAERDQRTASIRVDNRRLVATRIQSSTPKIDWVGLKKALGARPFGKLMERVPSKEKLQTALQDGEVDPDVAQQYIKMVDSKPYIKMVWEEQRDENESS